MCVVLWVTLSFVVFFFLTHGWIRISNLNKRCFVIFDDMLVTLLCQKPESEGDECYCCWCLTIKWNVIKMWSQMKSLTSIVISLKSPWTYCTLWVHVPQSMRIKSRLTARKRDRKRKRRKKRIWIFVSYLHKWLLNTISKCRYQFKYQSRKIIVLDPVDFPIFEILA